MIVNEMAVKMKFNNLDNRVVLLLVLILWALVGLGCASPGGRNGDGKLNVMVSIVPQQYFVERIGGEWVSVNVMVRPGDSPATYEPKPEQLKAVSKATAYFSMGMPFEDVWLEKIAEANADMLIVDTIAEIERMPIAEHHHEEANEHATGSPDPHVWVSPELVKVQSRAIYAALSQLDPEHQSEYQANLAAFIQDIDALQDEMRQTLSNLKSNQFMVFHPSWGYFARDFGLEQIAIEIEGQEPSAQELAALIKRAQEEGIQVVFAQPEFSTQDAETIAKEIGGEVLLVSPLALDWLGNMRYVAQSFADALGE